MAEEIPLGVSLLKIAPKKGSKCFRLVVNMHWLGKYIQVPRFKFEGLNFMSVVL